MVTDDHQDPFCWDGANAPPVAPSPTGHAPVRQRRGRLAAVAVLAGLAAGAATVLLAGGGGGTQPTTVLARAADVTAHMAGYRFKITMDASADGRGATVDAGGELNAQPLNGSMWLAVDGRSVDEVVVAPYAYVQIPSLSTAWNRVELPSQGAAGSSADVDVQQTISFLRSVGTVATVGEETVDGVAATHYHAVVDVERLASALPLARGSASSSDLAALSQALGGSGIPLDVWVDAQDRVRRIVMSMSIPSASGEAQFSMTIGLSDYGAQPLVSAPPDGQVTDPGASGRALAG